MNEIIAPTVRPSRAAGAGIAILAAAGGLGAVVTTEGASRTGELRLDEWLAADREWPLVDLARFITVAIGPLVGPLLVLIVCGVVAVRNRRAGLLLGLATAAGWLSVGVGKVVFGRHRPPTNLVHAVFRETGSDSFPSGHTALAAAFVFAAVLTLRACGHSTRWAWLLGVPFIAVVAASRLYLGVHYLGDVVASNLFAGGTILLLAAVLTWAAQRHSGLAARILPRHSS